VVVDWSASQGLEAGAYHGIDAVMRFYARGFDIFDEIVLTPDCFIDAGTSVLVPNKSRSLGREGPEVFTHSALQFTMRHNEIVRICLHQDEQHALKAVGLAE
jgi:hypothetical protein